jgi:Co/Zn/Cd efflux system component
MAGRAARVKEMLLEKHGIDHVTLQPEAPDGLRSMRAL